MVNCIACCGEAEVVRRGKGGLGPLCLCVQGCCDLAGSLMDIACGWLKMVCVFFFVVSTTTLSEGFCTHKVAPKG